MNPVYFPFTYISEPVIEALSSCFRQTIVYQATSQNIPESMKKWAEKGVLDIRTPVTTDEQKLTAIIRDYKNWANLHQGSEKIFLKFQKEKIPFFDDTSEIKIRSEIRNYNDVKKEDEKPDPLLNARIFLQIAQESDMQNRDVNQELDRFRGLEQKLMKHMHDDDTEFLIPQSEFQTIREDLGAYMTSERLDAWVCLMRQEPEASGIFITISPAILDLIMDKMPDMKLIHHWEAIPVYHQGETSDVWQDDFIKYLQNLEESDQPESIEEIPELPENKGADRTVSFRLYLIPGKTPHAFLNQCISKPESEKPTEINVRNTLIGMMEF